MTSTRKPGPGGGCPFQAASDSAPDSRRRGLLMGIGALGGAALAGPALAQVQAQVQEKALAGAQVSDAPRAEAGPRAERVAFHGRHQAGITTHRPANGLVAAFDLVVDGPDALEALLRRLTERASFLTQGGPVAPLDPKLPPSESGILGPEIAPDALTITVALGAGLFELDWLAPHRPAKLSRMVAFPNDALDPGLCHGDMSVQICANSADTVNHALRDLVKELHDLAVLRWMQTGSVPSVAPLADGTTPSARNLLGFRDGTGNPDSGDARAMDRLVWLGSRAGEPDWTRGGSYQAVRIIRNFVERWDRTPLSEQERDIGRRKDTGAPLDAGPDGREHDLPDYAADPEGKITPLGSHIRRANPRTAQTDRNLILRRPFNYVNGVTRAGQLDQGLLFIAYQADLEAGFITVQNRLNGEPLEEYFKPVGGGYFFALPGAAEGSYLGEALVTAARQSRASTQ